MTTRRRRRRAAAVGVLLLAVAGCAPVGRVLGGDQPTPGLDPVAVLPTGQPSPPPDAGTGGAASSPPVEPTATTPPTTTAPAPVTTPSADDVPPDDEHATGDQDPSGDAAVEAALVAARVPQLIAVDGSAAMAERFGAGTRQAAAATAVERLSLAAPDFVPLGLASFGDAGGADTAGRLESCSSVTTHASPGEVEVGAADVAGRPGAVGWRPLAAMLDLAAPALAAAGQRTGDHGAPPGRLIVITSGADSCGEDVLGVLDRLGDDAPVVDVIALAAPPDDLAFLADLAGRSGGTVAAADGPEGLSAAVDRLAARPADLVRTAACGGDRREPGAQSPLAAALASVDAAAERVPEAHAPAPTSCRDGGS